MANPLLNDEQRRRLASQNNTYNQIMQGFEEAERQQQPTESWLSGAARGAKAGFGGLGAGLLHAGQAAFGTDGSMANALDTMAEENAQRRDWSLADTFSLDYLTNPDGLAYGLGQIAGSMAIPALFGTGVAAAVPTGGLGLGALIGAAGAAPMAISEGGNTYAQGLKQGMSEEEAKKAGLIDAGIKLPFYMLSEGASGKIAQGLISKGLLNAEGKSLGRRAAEGAAKVVGNAANEAYEEGTENRSSAYALGDQRIGSLANVFNPLDWNDEDKAQGVGVFTPTLALGALTGGAGHLRNRFSKNKNADVSEEVDSEGGTIEDSNTNGQSNDAGREAFINAIAGQESGGNYDAVNGRTGAAGKYQIMPDNWPSWAEEAGLGADAEMTPENQEIVARYKLGEYYDKYGPRGAAMAWYAGEGSLNYSEEALNRKQGKGDEPSINEYADSVLARMGNYADTARIDDREENYFDESNYTDPSILSATAPARGFDVSNIGGSNEAADSNSLSQFEQLSPEAKKQREAYQSEQRHNALMQEIMAAGTNPTRGRQYAFTQQKQNPADALEHGFGGEVETVNNAKAFNNNIQTNKMRKRARENNTMPNYNFGVGIPGTTQNGLAAIQRASAIPTMMQAARSPREMASATNNALQYNNLLRQNYGFEAPQANNDTQDLAGIDRLNAELQREEDRQSLGNLIGMLREKLPQKKTKEQAERQALINILNARAAGQFDAAQQEYANRAKTQSERQAQAQAIANILNARAAQQWDAVPTAEKFKFVPQRQSMYDGALRRNLAAQDKIQPEELPSVEPTPINHRALEGRNFVENVIAAGRADYANGKRIPVSMAGERRKYRASVEARSFAKEYANDRDKREMLRNAAITVWTNDPKHPMKECRKNLNALRQIRKDTLQPIVNVMEQGMKQGVSLVPVTEFDGQQRGRMSRATNNAPWYSRYYKEHGKAPTKSQLYNIAEDIFFGNDEYGVGYYSDIKGKDIEKVIADNHETLDYINNGIEAFEALELKLKENPNYGKEWAKNQEATAEARATETAGNSEAAEVKAEPTAKSDKDEVNKKAPALAEGYTTESGRSLDEADEDEFILHKGEKNFGEITKVVADATDGTLKVAPIRLQVGNAEFGLKHLLKHEAQMQSKGFKNVYEFIDHVLKNFNQVYSQQTGKKPNRFVLYCKDDNSKGFMPIDLELKKDTNGYYTIVSAMPHKAKIKGTLIYDGSSRPSTATTDSLLSSDINGKGGDDAEIVLAKSNVPLSTQSVAQEQDNVKKTLLPKGVTADVQLVGNRFKSIVVKFNGKKPKEVSGIMGRAGYQWDSKTQSWKARADNEQAMAIAKELGYKPAEQNNNSVQELQKKREELLMKRKQLEEDYTYQRNGVTYDDIEKNLQEYNKISAELRFAKAKESKEETGNKYYLNERPAAPGTVPPAGLTRIDENDKGGRYGAIYYKLPLSDNRIKQYGLTVADKNVAKEVPTSDTSKNVVQSKQDNIEQGGSENDINSTEKLSQDDTGSRGTDNEVRGTVEGERPSAGDGQRSETPREQGRSDSDNAVSGNRTAAGRETSVRQGSEEASTADDTSSGSTELSTSVVDSLQGKPDVEGQTTRDVVEFVKDGRANAADTVTTKVDKVIKENNLNSKRASRLRKTAKAMPFLSTIQLSNNDFVANRFTDNGKQGVMITDGTGTGKTFSGLSVAKELIEKGKDNILIVTPSDSINNQWVSAAEDFFGINLNKLEDTKDVGKGAVITTYANLGANEALIKRNWDLVICDESHNLMNSEKGETTAALTKLRQLTLHHTELRHRAEQLILPEEKLKARQITLQGAKLKHQKDELTAEEKAIVNEADKLQKDEADKLTKGEVAAIDAQIKDWEALNETEKPKVMFMSATPFAYVPDIDYAEGYMFNYPKVEGGTYNQPGSGYAQFMMDHFGYRMRYNKLTKPDSQVDNAIMEVEFHEWLRKTGALTGHELEIDKDYNRGFLLVDQGVGRKIDEGFEFLQKNNSKYGVLCEELRRQFDNRRRNYLLESIKARESVPIIKEYLKTGKKVVVFYETNVERESFNPFKFTDKTKEILDVSGEKGAQAKRQWDMFAAERPDLVKLNLNDLKEPISIYREAFGDDAMFFNGRVSKKARAEYVKSFNDDDSGKNLIFVQQDAGNAGISLHDTTGKHQRVLINIGIPRRPSYAIQIEGRIYRLGNKSNAIIRYLTTATNIENGLFAETVAGRASTAENLALGRKARGLRDSFKKAYEEVFDDSWEDRLPGAEGEDTGGKESDRSIVANISDYDRAKAFYYGRGKKTAKNKSAEGVDYFATPEPVGYKMVEWAGLKDGDKVLEPSAGHGAISRFFSPKTENTIIEPSGKLAPQAQMNTENAKLINGYFEDLHISNKYDAITMNPPFGTGGKTAVEHVAKAFKHLKDGGRVIAIIPDGSATEKRFNKWYESDDAKDAHMVGEVLLPGVTFERAGTKAVTRIVLIDKGGESQGVKRIDLRDVDDINELFNKLENIEMPARSQRAPVTSRTYEPTKAAKIENQEADADVATADTYKHTKTGELIPHAKLNKSLSNEEYSTAKKLATKNDGYYSKFAKGFLFKTEEGRDNFVKGLNEELGNKYSLSDEATTRSRAEVEAEIKKALPSAELEQQADGSYIATMPNGKKLGIFIENQLLLNEQQAAEAGRAHNRIADEAEGYWNSWERLEGKNVDGVLRVSRNSRVGTAFHETLHAAMDLCLTSKEKAALYKSFAKKAQESGRSVDEEIADAYKEWAVKRQQGKGSMFGKLFQKAKDFLNKLYTMFVEAENKGNIFRKLESGKAWEQQGEKSSKNAQYLVTNNAITGETQVPVVDVSDLSKADISSSAIKANIAKGLIGKEFRIIGSNGIGKVASIKDGKHLLNSSNVRSRNDSTRLKTLSAIDTVLNNAIYIEKHDDENHGTNTKYIELYCAVKNKDNLIRFRIVAKEGNNKAGTYEVRTAKFYDIIKDGKVTANAQKALPAIIPTGMKGQVSGTIPSAISVAKLLEGVKGKDGRLLVNKNGGLNYEPKIFKGIKESIHYSVAPGKNKIASAFTNTERKGIVQSAKDFIKEQKKNFYTDMVDKNHILKSFDALTKATGGLSVYDSVQNLPSTTAGMLKAICEGGALSIKAANQHLKNVKMKHNVTLAMALDQINKKTMDKAQPQYLAANGFDSWINAFGAYLGAERLLEINDLTKADGKVYKFPKGLTEAELRAFTRNAPQQFRKAADMFYKVNDNMISVMEDAQVFTPELAKALRTKYKKYCPLLRDFSDTAAADTFINGLTEGGRGIGNVSIPLKKINIEGSERGVMNPLESVLKSYAVMLNRAERNKVGLMAVNAAKTAQLHDLIKEMPEKKDVKGNVVNAVADPKNCIFTVLVNGKKKAYQTTQELYAPIVGYNLPAAGLCINVARMAAHMLRTGATMSPSFIVRNLLRDTVFAGISSKNGFIPIVDSIRGAMALWNDPAMRAEFEAAGVTEFNFYGSQKARIKSLDAMAGEKPVGLLEMIKWAATHLEAASDFVESSTRMGEFMKARKNGLSMEEAARAAREVTLDFSRSGVVGEQINRYVPFFNACIQGGDKMVRLFKEDPWGTSQKLFQYIVLPSLILWSMNHDEDWYKDLDPDIKNNYWLLGEHLRIPKPQEAGVLFGSGIEALLDQAEGKDKDALINMAKAFISNMVPGIVPTLFLPLLEWQANYSYFKGKALVGSKYQRLPDELQYNDYTSELSKAIGNNPIYKVSPMKVDNLIRGYTGTMGGLLWSAPDAVIGNSKNLPEKHLSERVFFRDFTVTDANKSRPMNDFYDILDKANRQHAGYGVKGKPAEAVKGIRAAGTAISKIRKDVDKITHSNLTPERKRELIDKRKEKMTSIARKATERYGKYFD